MAGYVVSERVERPRAEVWSFIVDMRNAPRWLGVVSAEHTGGTPGAVGARYLERRRVTGMTVEGAAEVLICEPERRYALSYRDFLFDGRWDYALAEVTPSATNVAVSVTLAGSGWRGALAPLLVSMLHGVDKPQLERLKAALEQAR